MGGRFLRSEDMDLTWRREAMEACGEERMVLNMIGIDGGWRIEARAKICERKKEGGGDLAADSLKNFASVLGKGLCAMMLLCKQKTFPVATAKRSFRINSFDEKKTEEIIERIIRTYIHAQTTNINGVSSY